MADRQADARHSRTLEDRVPTGVALQILGRNEEDASHRPPVVAVAGVPNRAPNPQLPAIVDNIGPSLEHLHPTQQPSYNWQATKMTLKERFQYLFNNETRSDVHFLVGRGLTSQRIPAHKFVLSVGSAVFDAMFNSILATQSEDVDLPDVEPAAFLSLLKFLYTDEVNIGPETVMTTLYTAKKYAVPALEAQCVGFLKKNLNPDNAFMLLTQARLFDEPQLAKMCLQCIDKYTKEALSADGFTDIDYSTLLMFLQRDTVGLREVYIFSAVERWSEGECNRQELEATKENKRKVVGEALYAVRFPLMSIEEFAQGPAQSGILTDREVIDLFLYFTLNPKPRVRFSDKSRCSLTGKEQSVCRFIEVAERWGYSGTSDRIKFCVDSKIFVVGFGLYGAIQGSADYQVNIQIITCDNRTVLAQNETGFSCDGSSKTYRVMFKQPVEIRPNIFYIASATINGHDSYYGTRGQTRVIKDQNNQSQTVFSFHFDPGNNNGTTVEDGQIPEIIYYQ